MNGTIQLDNKIEFNNNEMDVRASNVATKVGEALEEEYGRRYFDRYIGSLTERGYTAMLYQTMDFEIIGHIAGMPMQEWQ